MYTSSGGRAPADMGGEPPDGRAKGRRVLTSRPPEETLTHSVRPAHWSTVFIHILHVKRCSKQEFRSHTSQSDKRWGSAGEPRHNGTQGDTRAHGSHRRTSQPSQPNNPPNGPMLTPKCTRTTARRPNPWPTQQPLPRSRPLPAADSEEAAPCKPDPAATRCQSASPRLLKGGRRNEGARCRRRDA
jgi:hypothetical protein